jgi:hypothetical protein
LQEQLQIDSAITAEDAITLNCIAIKVKQDDSEKAIQNQLFFIQQSVYSEGHNLSMIA